VGIRVKSVNLSNLSSGQICQAVRILLALRGELDGAASSALRFDFGDGGSQGDGEAKKRAQGDCGGVQGQWSAPGGKKNYRDRLFNPRLTPYVVCAIVYSSSICRKEFTMTEEMIPLPDAARIIGVNSNTLRMAVRRGTVKAVKILGRIKIPREEVERLREGKIYGNT
jgi:hypothetical protein